METFKIVDGDIIFDEQGDLMLVNDDLEVIQSINRILTTNKGEWFLNVDFGLNYNEIQGKGKSIDNMKLAVTEAILQEERVESIVSLVVELLKNRGCRIFFKAKIKSGNLVEGEVII